MNLTLANDREFIEKLTGIIVENMGDENFGVVELIKKSGLSSDVIRHRLKVLTRKTINQFINEIRLKVALKMLTDEALTVSEVSFKTGFGSPGYFGKCFHDYYGCSPGEIKRKIQFEGIEIDTILNSAKQKPQILKLKESNSGRKIRKKIIITSAGILILILIGYLIFDASINPFSVNLFSLGKKSIAVLPFYSDSHDPENEYFLNGVCEIIRYNLSQISDLDVRSRISVERYRNNSTRLMKQIARELKVKYIVEGSGQKVGDKILIHVQLIKARNDEHLLSENYTKNSEDEFILNSEIVLDLASKIKARITPEEKELIQNVTASRIAAYSMLNKGNDFVNVGKHFSARQREEHFRQAEKYYRNAIINDSLFTDAYIKLGELYYTMRNYDSVIYVANRVLKYDSRNPEAFLLMAQAYSFLHLPAEMETSIKTGLNYNPENPWFYFWLGGLNFGKGELSEGISYLFKTKKMMGSLKSDFNEAELWKINRNTLHIFRCLYDLGFYDEAKKFGEEWLELSVDTMGYYYIEIWSNIINQKFNKANEIIIQNKKNGSKIPGYYIMTGINFFFLGNYSLALENLEKMKEKFLEKGFEAQVQETNSLIGFALLKNGQKDIGNKYLESSASYFLNLMKKDPLINKPDLYYVVTDRLVDLPCFILACSYSALGNIEKALEYLKLFSESVPVSDLQIITYLKYYPMLDNIRNTPEFRSYLNHVETRYAIERKKVEKILRYEEVLVN